MAKKNTKKIIGGLLFLGALGTGVWLYKTGRIGFSGLGQMREHGPRAKRDAVRWMEQAQAYRMSPSEGGKTIQRVNRTTGASDETAAAFYSVLRRNAVESPNHREFVGPDGIGRPW